MTNYPMKLDYITKGASLLKSQEIHRLKTSLVMSLLMDLEQQDKWSIPDIDFISESSTLMEASGLSDPYSLIGVLTREGRELSSGATTLSKVLIPTKLYKTMEEESKIDTGAELKFRGAKLFPVQQLENEIIGLFKSKYDFIDPKYLAITLTFNKRN